MKKLGDNNLDCERDLSHMDKLAKREATCSNKKSKAQGMRDDMTLYQANVTSIDDYTKRMVNILDEKEKDYSFTSQNALLKKKR